MVDERRPPAEFLVRFCECLNRFIGLADLLANKRAAGRPKDLADVEALEHPPELPARN